MGHGLYIAAGQGLKAGDPHRVVILNDLRTGLLQLSADRLQMLGNHILHQHIAAAGSSRHHIGARLDLVRDNGVGAAVHLLHPANFNYICAGAAHIGTHRV